MKHLKSPLIILVISTVFLSGCFGLATGPGKDPYLVTIVNQSEVSIQQIQYNYFNFSGGVANADGSPFAQGDQIELDFADPDGEVLLSARNAQDETLGAARIKFNFNEDNQMTVYIHETSSGVDFQLAP